MYSKAILGIVCFALILEPVKPQLHCWPVDLQALRIWQVGGGSSISIQHLKSLPLILCHDQFRYLNHREPQKLTLAQSSIAYLCISISVWEFPDMTS